MYVSINHDLEIANVSDSLRSGISESSALMMNDPMPPHTSTFPNPLESLDTNSFTEDAGPSDNDHCRICRGEGTAEEPLFYPCKCNGSIRFVHQACLMQWLSHSQKKHCELCKTPYRFTKLYDPSMPTVVPWPVFLQQASVHVARFFIKCARWMLVLFVWLAWVPWCMRAVWRGLFWIGDGSWITPQQLARHARLYNSTVAVTATQTMNQATQVVTATVTKLVSFSNPIAGSRTPGTTPLSTDTGENVFLWIGRRMLNTIIFPYSALSNTSDELKWEIRPRAPSLLSDVKLLKTLTKYKLVNETLIDILEGQLITVGILITFILIFLIREWVVQQQPMINLGQALEGQVNNPQPEQPRPVIPAVVEEVENTNQDAEIEGVITSAGDSTDAVSETLADVSHEQLDTSAQKSASQELYESFGESWRPEPEPPRMNNSVPSDDIDSPVLVTPPLPSSGDSTPAADQENDTISPSSLTHAERQVDQTQAPSNQPLTTDITDWMWGGLPVSTGENDASDNRSSQWDSVAGNDGSEDEVEEFEFAEEHQPEQANPEIIEQIPDNPAPFPNAHQDPEVLRAAAEAGIEPNEAGQIEEGEDMDGVMELIGMQGPLVGLLQNGMFSTVIISMTVLFGIWIPYLVGKIVLIVIANPVSLLIKMPLQWISTIADLVIDSFIFFSGCAYYWVDQFVRLTATPINWILPFVKTARMDNAISSTAYRLTWSAAERLGKNLAVTGGYFQDSDIPVFSILAHESLELIETKVANVFIYLGSILSSFLNQPAPLIYVLKKAILFWAGLGLEMEKSIRHAWVTPASNNPDAPSFLSEFWKISLNIAPRTEPLKITPWSASDKVFAAVLGYTFFASLGFFYLKLRRVFREANDNERPSDGLVVDILNQAGGVFKVILIIAIEMLVFPLYCGFLLDIALLPLFGNATMASRMAFLNRFPWTSVFIHWFAGTCYMFHFALFVAMCRKILRTGVLYFIRDPDDPSFHPVRDVLERNITTQLRKIMFSALVYGGLVIVCLGAVVWGISAVFEGVFPIHWSSNEPVLEFPSDLLVYNFLIPFVVRLFKPSTALQDMYNWWFRKCARLLRLSHFLFNERNHDEEGYTVWERVNSSENSEETKPKKGHVWPSIYKGRMSWQTRAKLFLNEPAPLSDPDPSVGYKQAFIHDGRLVRAPASDQVRIPKGSKTFVDIDPVTRDRKDGLTENPNGLHGKDNKMFLDIYVPPWFRLRIASFIILIWAFAAFTGVSFTVVPLLFGRFIFAELIQSGPRMNDVYAFAIGLCLLGGPAWLTMRYRKLLSRWSNRGAGDGIESIQRFLRTGLPKVFKVAMHILRLVYFYGAFAIVLPSLLGLVWEAYILVPLHTYFQRTDDIVPSHTVHFVSDWTLGVLFVRVAVHVFLKYPESRPTKALVAMVSAQNRGSSWLDPDVRLATRAFIVPLTLALSLALMLPLGLGRLIVTSVLEGIGEGPSMILYRYSYPVFLALNLAFALFKALQRGINKWRSRVRDEVYLIGERLHNFDDRRGNLAT